MTTPQSQILSHLHVKLLKPRGFKKLVSRCERQVGSMHQAVVIFSSQFNGGDSAKISIELRVTHEEFFYFHQPNRSFPGLVENFMPLLSWRLHDHELPTTKWWQVNKSSDVMAVSEEVVQSLLDFGVDDLELTKTISGIVAFYRRRQRPSDFQALSWALAFEGDLAAANAVLDEAVSSTPTEKIQSAVEVWRRKLSNWAFERASRPAT